LHQAGWKKGGSAASLSRHRAGVGQR
jgi:hypothetical protein